MQQFDVLIIGGGPGGYLAGERAAQAGLSACVIEEKKLGGVCLNEGCIPTKTLLNSAKMYDYASSGSRYGVSVEGARIDHGKVIDRKNMVVKQLVAGVTAKLKHHDVPVLSGHGKLLGKEGAQFLVQAGEETVCGKYVVLATGSEPIIPPIPGLKEAYEGGFLLTNREILDLREVPERLCIIGGGVIGLEMASYFCSIGTKVTVIEMLDKIAGPTEPDVSAILQKNYQKKGVKFLLGCKVVGVEQGVVTYEENGEQKVVETDRVLLSIGRRAKTNDLGLETLGVAVERGTIVTDVQMQTNVPGIYAVGDVNSKSMLAHTAYREAEVAINNIAGKLDAINYNTVASVIYTNPEVASCGFTLQGAKDAGINANEISISMRYSGRYLAEVAGGDGICKLIVDQDKNTLVGVHLIGSYVSESIYGVAIMIDQQIDIEDIKKIVFPHPTICEVIREALFE